MSQSRIELLNFIDVELRYAGLQYGLFQPEDILDLYASADYLYEEEIEWIDDLTQACCQVLALPPEEGTSRIADMTPYVIQLLTYLTAIRPSTGERQ